MLDPGQIAIALEISSPSRRNYTASADDYQEIFGEVAEDDARTALSISLSSSAAETARRAAALSGTTLSAYIESLIWLNAKKID